jgi:hypothetical protein
LCWRRISWRENREKTRQTGSLCYGIALAPGWAIRRPAPDFLRGIEREVRGLVLNNLFTLVQTLLNYVLGLVGGVLPIGL